MTTSMQFDSGAIAPPVSIILLQHQINQQIILEQGAMVYVLFFSILIWSYAVLRKQDTGFKILKAVGHGALAIFLYSMIQAVVFILTPIIPAMPTISDYALRISFAGLAIDSILRFAGSNLPNALRPIFRVIKDKVEESEQTKKD